MSEYLYDSLWRENMLFAELDESFFEKLFVERAENHFL